jgi:hypothetical protein
MTTTRAGDLEPAIAAERESIEAEIAGGTLLTAFAETTGRRGGTEAYRWRRDGRWRTLTYTGAPGAGVAWVARWEPGAVFGELGPVRPDCRSRLVTVRDRSWA